MADMSTIVLWVANQLSGGSTKVGFVYSYLYQTFFSENYPNRGNGHIWGVNQAFCGEWSMGFNT